MKLVNFMKQTVAGFVIIAIVSGIVISGILLTLFGSKFDKFDIS